MFKPLLLLGAPVLLLGALPACSLAASQATQTAAAGDDRRSYPARDFDSVALGGVGDVEVRTGGDFSVVAMGSPAALDALLVGRDGSVLKLEKRRGVAWPQGAKVRFLITMPRIAGADIGGSGSVAIDRATGDAFSGNIGGSGNLDIRQMTVDRASFAIGGSGHVSGAGRARQLKVNIGGSGDVQLRSLSARTASVSVAGAGNVAATVSDTADVTLVGSGDVAITGGARCKVTKMGGGSVRCG